MINNNTTTDKPYVQIHGQLQRDPFNFCKVEKLGKKPFEEGWIKHGYKWDDPDLQAWLSKGGNYGCIGGHGDLVIFDADDLTRLQELKVIDLLPETFTVRTPGRGGWHLYYICPGVEKKQALYDPEKTAPDKKGREKYIHVADLVSFGLQAVGAGSVRSFEGGKLRAYEVIKDMPIAQITLEQLQEAIKCLRTSSKIEKNPAAEKPQEEKQAGYRRWADSLHVEDILIPDNIMFDDLEGTGELQGSHPIHGSENGRNFAINIKKNTWVCFRCTPPAGKGKENCGGGPWELLGVREGILECDDCYKGWRKDHPEKWAQVIARAKELGIEGVPRLADGENISELRRDIIRYCVDVILGSEHIKTLESGEILVYEGGAYRKDGITYLKGLIQKLGGGAAGGVNINVVQEVLDHIRRETPAKIKDFDNDPTRLSVRNGILNLLTGELEPHTYEFLTLVQLPVDYVPGADCPKIKKFMNEIVEPKYVPVLEEIAGYCLYRNHELLHKGFMLLGEGRNGKSTYTKLLTELVGLEHTSNVPIQKLETRFRNSELIGSLLNCYTDLPNITLAMTGVFKAITSGDPITVEEKYLKPIKLVNFSKQVFSANELPKTMDESYGFFSRLVLIDFPYKFEGSNRDPFLLQKLTTSEEMSGFLNLAIQGLMRLLEKKALSVDLTVDEVMEDYTARTQPVKALQEFMEECCLSDTRGYVEKDKLYAAYEGWCWDNEKTPITQKAFFTGIAEGWAVVNYRPPAGADGKRPHAYKGLVFSSQGKNTIKAYEKYC